MLRILQQFHFYFTPDKNPKEFWIQCEEKIIWIQYKPLLASAIAHKNWGGIILNAYKNVAISVWSCNEFLGVDFSHVCRHVSESKSF
jgi:hypothetical protein